MILVSWDFQSSQPTPNPDIVSSKKQGFTSRPYKGKPMVKAFKQALLLVCKWFLSFSSRVPLVEMEVHGAIDFLDWEIYNSPILPILPRKGSHMRPISRRGKTGKSGNSHLKFHLCCFFSSPKGVHAMPPNQRLVPGDSSTDLVRRRWRKRREDTTELCNRTVHPAGPRCQ